MLWFKRAEVSILFVCTANVCRSPMAEGLLRSELSRRGMARRIRVDSAGTHANQPGRGADPRAQLACSDVGVDLRKSRARQITQTDYAKFDHILAMDGNNYRWLLDACPEPYMDRISLMAAWNPDEDREEIPDPYYGNMEGFQLVLRMLQTSIFALVEALEKDVQS